MTVPTKHGSSAHSHTLQLVLGSFLWPKGQWFSHQGMLQEAVEIKKSTTSFLLVAQRRVTLQMDSFLGHNILWFAPQLSVRLECAHFQSSAYFKNSFFIRNEPYYFFLSYVQFFLISQSFPPHPFAQMQFCLPIARHVPLFLHGFSLHPINSLALPARFLISCQRK